MLDNERLLAVLKEINEDVDFENEPELMEVLDSLEIMQIVNALDEEFGIQIRAVDIDPDNFTDLAAIGKLVSRYLDA